MMVISILKNKSTEQVKLLKLNDVPSLYNIV